MLSYCFCRYTEEKKAYQKKLKEQKKNGVPQPTVKPIVEPEPESDEEDEEEADSDQEAQQTPW